MCQGDDKSLLDGQVTRSSSSAMSSSYPDDTQAESALESSIPGEDSEPPRGARVIREALKTLP